MSAPPWTGTWVADRLGITLDTTASATGLRLEDLVGMAVRRNPRRAHLLVSTVLGKHVPTDPALVHGAGRLLGVLTGQALAFTAPRERLGGAMLAAALTGNRTAARALVARCQSAVGPPAPPGTVVLGYAETATALGHCVAAQLGAPVLHSTRRAVPGLDGPAGFEEEHSHASSHLLLPADPDLVAVTGPLVLVDDELSTGRTALNTITALHAAHPRGRYVIAALVDLRSSADQDRMTTVARQLGARIDVVALAAGTVRLPTGVLAAGAELAAGIPPLAGHAPDRSRGTLSLHENTWPADVPDGGRHGLTPAQDRQLTAAAAALAADLATSLPLHDPVHVLGTEELMYAPLLIAQALAGHTSAPVTYSTTTRSPVLVVDDPGYAISSGITFPAHDDPSDGPGPRYAYNLPERATTVLVIDDTADTPPLYAPDGLVAQLAASAPHLAMVTLPSHRPAPTPPGRPHP